jgi:hypothetical protein
LDFFDPEGERIEDIAGSGDFAVVKGRLLPVSDLQCLGDENWLVKRLQEVRSHLRYCLEQRSYYSDHRRIEVIESCEFIILRLQNLAVRLFGGGLNNGVGSE